jgi:hypothetical protein
MQQATTVRLARRGGGRRAPSRDVEIDPARLQAALETLARGERGHDVGAVLGFVELMMAHAVARPDAFSSWLPGRLVIVLRPGLMAGTTMHLLGDVGWRYQEMFWVAFPRLDPADARSLIEWEPGRVGPAFVHIGGDEVTISIVTYVDREAVEASWGEQARESAGLDAEVDADATLVFAPSVELLGQLRA